MYATAPEIVVRNIGGNAEQIIPSMCLAFTLDAASQEAVVGFLKQIIGQLSVAGFAPEEYPDWTRRLFVNSKEAVLYPFRMCDPPR